MLNLRCILGHRWVVTDIEAGETFGRWVATATLECSHCGKRSARVSPREWSTQMFFSKAEALAWARGQGRSPVPDCMPSEMPPKKENKL